MTDPAAVPLPPGISIVELAGLGVALCTVWITALALLWKHLDKRFDQERERSLLLEQQFQTFKTEVYRDFVRSSENQTNNDEIRKLMHEVFERLNTLSRDLNLLIGEYRGKNSHA